jgi:hypothetical protein
MEQHDAEWAAAPYAYSASEGAICDGTMSRGELKAGRLLATAWRQSPEAHRIAEPG